jgi:hypothetical protein
VNPLFELFQVEQTIKNGRPREGRTGISYKVEIYHDMFRKIGALDATDALYPLGCDLFNRTSLKDIREEDLVKAFVVWISCAASRNTDLSG